MTDREVTVEDLEDLDKIIGTQTEKKAKAKDGDGRPKTSRSGGSKSSLSNRLNKMIRLLGSVIEPMDSFDGQILKDNSREIADALADLANESERVRRFLEGSLEGGAWTAVGVLVGGKVALPIAVHHRMLPATMNDQIAKAMDVPVRPAKRKRQPEGVSFIVPTIADDEPGEDGPVRYGRVRDPETGDMVTVPLDPTTGRPKVDGDGRPIIDEAG